MCYNLKMESKLPFISRVIIKNYKSIAHCDVRLGALQFLVGRNGSGKSNFLDALAFVRDALANSLEYAFSVRQGINQVRRRSGGHPQNVGVRLDINLGGETRGHFAFELTSKKGDKFRVKEEYACIDKGGTPQREYRTLNGEIQGADKKKFPPVSSSRLYLQSMATFDEFQPMHDALQMMGVYNINPKLMAKPHEADTETLLKSDGSNIAASLDALHPGAKDNIRKYLRMIVPFISDVNPSGELGKAWQVVEFSQEVKGPKYPWRFPAINMSDGTLRALGILTALLQKREQDVHGYPPLVGIEEPETALHARASGVLLGALRDASDMRQVVVTTHGADMLDDKNITSEQILPVELKESETKIAPVENITREMLEEHLTTPGELLRQDKLKPDSASTLSAPLFTRRRR